MEVQIESTQPLYQPSEKKVELHVPIAMKKIIASSVEKKATGKTYVPFHLKNNTHWDCKGHGGTMMVMGCGAISSYSRRIKVNTMSSTEIKLVSVDSYMPEVMWSLYFIQAQGYGVKYAEIHQDNVSAQMLETNGKLSSSRKTKYIKAKFFFI